MKKKFNSITMQHRIDLLWKAQEGTKMTICKAPIDEINHFKAFAATLGITQKKVFILDINSSINIPDFQLKQFRGVEIQLIPDQDFKSLVVILLEDSLFDTFCHLIEDIINSLKPLSQEDEAVKKIFKIIGQWKRLFEKTQIEGLTFEEQKGLYGELLIVKHLIQNGVSADLIINSWSGPDKKNHDFIFESISIEVKTTSANHPVIRISNENQLSHSNKLCLVLIMVNEKRGSVNTLPNLIEELRSIFYKISDECLDIFNEKLFNSKYYNSHRDMYALTEYSVRKINAYNVLEGFPRIVPEKTMNGIFCVNYQIETSACIDYLTDYPTFILDCLKYENSK